MSDTDLLAAMEAQIERLIRERDHANMTCDAAADKIEALQTRVNELDAHRHQDALDGQAALEDRDQRIQELETRLDWNHMRHVGEPEDAAEDIAYLRNMLRLSNERVNELERERDHANMVADAAIEELKLRQAGKAPREETE